MVEFALPEVPSVSMAQLLMRGDFFDTYNYGASAWEDIVPLELYSQVGDGLVTSDDLLEICESCRVVALFAQGTISLDVTSEVNSVLSADGSYVSFLFKARTGQNPYPDLLDVIVYGGASSGAADNFTLLIDIDVDSDWVYDSCDNCPKVSNPDQADSDGDGAGDVCDVCGGADDGEDCDANDVPDCVQVVDDPSSDCNSNAIPDVCDTEDGSSVDCNSNSIPDECEPDCNHNFIADECDILNRSSLDCQSNGVPDECELGTAAILLVSSKETDSVLAYDGVDGAFLYEFVEPGGGGLDYPGGLAVDAAGAVYVPSINSDSALKFSGWTGELLLTCTGGGLDGPVAVLALSTGSLLICSYQTDSVLEFSSVSGEFVGTFVAESAGGLDGPAGLTLTPEGNVLVASQRTDEVLEYDGASGAFIRIAAAGNGLDGPSAMVFDSAGNLLVTSFFTDSVLKFALDGTFIEMFVDSGSGGLDGAEGLALATNGNLLVSSRFGDAVLEFDGDSGDFVGTFASGGGLDEPTYIAFLSLADTSADCQANGVPDECELDCNANEVPDECDLDDGAASDCNLNGIPDECDIAGGVSDDCDADGVPDECEPECNGNGVPDDCDIASGGSDDCNGNAVPDECDLAAGKSDDCNADDTPDECQVPPIGPPGSDCNANFVPDECDIASGLSGDCQPNGVPDECDLAAGTSTDVNDNSIPDECEPPVLISAAGVVEHGGLGNLPIELSLAGPVVTDPRLSAGGRLELRLGGAIDPVVVENEANILITRATGGTIDPADFLAELDAGGTTVILTFPGLPNERLDDQDHYTVDLSAVGVVGDAVFDIRVLAGDVNGDGTVDPLDSGAVLARFGDDITNDPRYDVNADGMEIDPLDAGAVLARFGNAAP